MKCKRLAVGTLVIVFVVCGAARRSCAQDGNWDERFGLPNLGSVFALGLTDDGKLYTGGSFSGNAFGAGGGLNANSICAWNGSHWLRLGDEAVTNGTSGSVFAIATVGSAVYVGGDFGAVNDLVTGRLGVNSVAKWDGNRWSRLGNDTDYGVVGQVYALAADGTNVYVGGRFFRAGGVNTTNIAKWDGRQWSALGSGLGNGQTDRVTAIALGPDGSVYAAGNFTNSASVALNRIAKWDGANWTPLGSGVDDLVFALTLKDGELYAGGQFLQAGGNTAKRLAKWDGSQWTEVGGGITDGPVYSLTTSSNDLFVGGDFTAGGSTPLSGVGKWDGSSWSDLVGGVRTGNSGAVYSLIARDGVVYAGGQFARAGSLTAFGVAKWDGQSWSALNKALVGDQLTEINAIAIQGTNVFVGGEFTSAGGLRANRLSIWDGYNWSAPSSGSSNEFDQQVLAVAVAPSGDVYAGGKFFWAGGTIVHGIAKWDGASWSPLGSGLTGGGDIHAIALTTNGDVYAGGFFTSIGGVNANGIARWDGTNWWDVAGGVTRSGSAGSVRVLLMAGSDLYVGGAFDAAGGVPAGSLAKWNGAEWLAVGGAGVAYPGFQSSISALAISGSDLYVGGAFIQAGGINASRIARWDGQNWSAMGSGTDSDVYTIAVAKREVFIGGNFTRAGGQSIRSLARWVGEQWWPVGSGITGVSTIVSALATNETGLFVGGNFPQTGDKPANSFGRWSLTNDLPLIRITAPSNGSVFAADQPVVVSADAASPNGSVTRVEFYAETNLLGIATDAPYTFAWSNAPPDSHLLSAKVIDDTGVNQTSTAVPITVNPPPTGPIIAQQPVSQTSSNGAVVVISVQAAGQGTLSYQWLKDSIPIPNETNASLTLTDTQLGDSARYTVAITDSIGTTTSAPAVVSILQPVLTLWVRRGGLPAHTSPAVGEGGVVYFGTDNKNLFAYGPNGTYEWRFLTGDYVQSSPAIAQDGTLYFGSRDRKIYALNSDGTEKWEFLTGFIVTGSPAIGADGTIYIGSNDKNLYALSPSGTQQWAFAAGGDIAASAAISTNGTIYFTAADQKLYALNPDGTKQWAFAAAGGMLSSLAIGADGVIYFGCNDKKLYAMNPDGTQRWTFTADGPVWSSPVIGADGTIYFGSDGLFDPSIGVYRGRFYAINPDGSEKWDWPTGAPVRSAAAVAADGTVCFGSDEGKFYALNPNGTERWEVYAVDQIESSPAIRFDGVVYFATYGGDLYAVQGSSPLADTPWPIFQHDLTHSGNAGMGRRPDVWFYPFQSNAFDDEVRAVAMVGPDMYVGGDFHIAGGVPASNIARWDGTNWLPAGGGVNGSVYSIAAIGSDIYAGGFFTQAGGTNANFVARWDGTNWFPLGSGSREFVWSLAVLNNELYAPRSFLDTNGMTINGVSKWNGQTWTPVGEDLGHLPFALGTDGVRLFAGGINMRQNNLLVWDGNSWSPLGGGVYGEIRAITTVGTDIYVGGDFQRAGGLNGLPVNSIAKWNGTSWSSLGGGVVYRDILDSYVFAITAVGTDIYAGGYFLSAGGVPTTSIARWDGQSWHSVGGGVQWDAYGGGSINAFGVIGDRLFGGGAFLAAGGNRSIHYFGQWDGTSWSSLGKPLSFVNGKFQFALTDQIGRTYGVEASSDLVNWTRVTTYTNIGSVVQFIDNASTNLSRRFYRTVTP